MKLITDVYLSSRQDEMYLYVAKAKGLADVPQQLLEHFGAAKRVLSLVLTPDKKLAWAEAPKVLEAINNQGYYLQIPPPKDDYLLDLYRTPTKAAY